MAAPISTDQPEGGDFEDIVDSPYGQDHAQMMMGTGDDMSTADADFTIEGTSSPEDARFDNTVGILQDIVMDDAFNGLLNRFLAENSHHFEDTEENKLVYTELFQQYSSLIEGILEKQLQQAMPGFVMAHFLEELARRGEGEMDSAVFDLLCSLGDFGSFKESMLADKAAQARTAAGEGALALAATASKIHEDEESGDERPDLEDLLLVAPASPKGGGGGGGEN